MERDNDLLLNVICSRNEPTSKSGKQLPVRMPDGSRIDANRNLTRKIIKTHLPASNSSNVFIPKHKLPVLDEFGLSAPVRSEEPHARRRELRESARAPQQPPAPIEKSSNNGPRDQTRQDKPKGILKSPSASKGEPEKGAAAKPNSKLKRRKFKKKEEEPKIIPKEVQLVAGGLPPSFPKHRIRKFTEEYQQRQKRKQEEGDDDGEEGPEAKKKRRSFVPGLNPRKREKAANLFTNMTLQDLEDLHPYMVSNLEQNFEIKELTRIQSLVMPELLKTRFSTNVRDFIVNSGIGSGKILSYIVPIVNNLALIDPRIDRTAGIYAMILLPTRELAAKVNEIFMKLCRSFLWVVPGLLTGGERKKSEKARLRKGLNILITTPGRLIDHMEHSKSMDFAKMKYCVLGDAHRLLDPERAEVAKQIAILLRKRLPSNCVRCVVTATFTKKLEKLTEIILTTKPKVIDAFKEFE